MRGYTSFIITNSCIFDGEDSDELRKQGVDVDDWDLMIFFKDACPMGETMEGKAQFNDYQIEQIFDNHCDDDGPAVYDFITFRDVHYKTLIVKHH